MARSWFQRWPEEAVALAAAQAAREEWEREVMAHLWRFFMRAAHPAAVVLVFWWFCVNYFGGGSAAAAVVQLHPCDYPPAFVLGAGIAFEAVRLWRIILDPRR